MNKYIDKLIESPWFIRIVALLLALLLFENVYEENGQEVNVPQDKQVEVIEDVPVKVYYDTENLVVTGVPETVTLTLSGPRSNLTQAVTQRAFEVYVDLTEAEIGKQTVPIQVENISDRLDVTIEPEFAEVSVQEKITKEFSVEVEFNSDMVHEGYVSENISIEPNKVKITGAKDVIDQVTYVKAVLNIDGTLTETIKQKAEILVLDESLNKLSVETDPKTVDVTISIKALSKKVPIQLVEKGNPPNGISIRSIAASDEEATIIAPEDVLEKINAVQVEIDVSKVDEDTEMTVPVNIPNGVVNVNPKTVDVEIDIEQTENRNFSNLPIEVKGLENKFMLSFLEPEEGEVDLTVAGFSEEVRKLKKSDFQILVDVSDLKEGEHELDILVEGPENIEWQLNRKKTKIRITES